MVNLNTAVPSSKSGSNTALILLGLAAAAGLGYYFFVYKPEQDKKDGK